MAGIVDALYKKVDPDIRLYLEFMFGKDTTITEDDFTAEQLGRIRNSVDSKVRRQQREYERESLQRDGLAVRHYGATLDKEGNLIFSDAEDEQLYDEAIKKPLVEPDSKRVIMGYGDHPRESVELTKDGTRRLGNDDISDVLKQTLGAYVAHNDDENLRIEDEYNFNKDENKYFGLPEEPTMSEGVKRILFGNPEEHQFFDKTNRFRDIAEILARVTHPNKRREVDINIPKNKKTKMENSNPLEFNKGGKVKMPANYSKGNWNLI